MTELLLDPSRGHLEAPEDNPMSVSAMQPSLFEV